MLILMTVNIVLPSHRVNIIDFDFINSVTTAVTLLPF